ncbi:response regulator [Thiolapillus sp.]|uniref:response regulator n=13 Tax=Thiolapillus sp. TaxID=2017437 RepID=UPI003AF774C5
MKVLLVDDSKAARFAMGKLLKDQGLEVEMAASGEEALDKIATEAIDIVFMDQSMPGMGGIAATTAITSNEKTAHIPVVLCTGNEGSKLEQMAEEAGAIGVLTKPPQEDKLKAVLATINMETVTEETPEEEAAPEEAAAAPAIDMDAIKGTIMTEVETLLKSVRDNVTGVEKNMEQKLAELAKSGEEKLQPIHDSLKKMDDRVISQVKEQIAMDTGNSRIQLEALRQQVETALEDIKEQEIRLREDVMEQSGSRLESLIDERLAELKDSVRESQEAMEEQLAAMQAKVAGTSSLLGKATLIAILAAGAAFAAAWYLLK